MSTIEIDDLKIRLVQNCRIIDVRAPVEFSQGRLPNSVNLPLLDDRERTLVGTCFKNSGQEKAIELGHQLVAGENKAAKIKKWKDFIELNPHAILTCYRGGLRSRLSQEFLKAAGIEIPRIKNGYKEVRQFFIDSLLEYSETQDLRLLTGNTGSGKTKILNRAGEFYPVVDLEQLAMHRGSAFGAMAEFQPAQASFENMLAHEILKLRSQCAGARILYEDESRLIGSLHLPEKFFERLRKSRVIKMNVSLEHRVENIFLDYIRPEMAIFEKYMKAVTRIGKKLGGARMQELLIDLNYSQKQFSEMGLLDSNKVWIEKLLVWYYDPMYSFSLAQRKPLIEFEGSPAEVLDYLAKSRRE